VTPWGKCNPFILCDVRELNCRAGTVWLCCLVHEMLIWAIVIHLSVDSSELWAASTDVPWAAQEMLFIWCAYWQRWPINSGCNIPSFVFISATRIITFPIFLCSKGFGHWGLLFGSLIRMTSLPSHSGLGGFTLVLACLLCSMVLPSKKVCRVPGYRTEMYCVSCEVRTEFIYVM
jgi:hypothetical protein